MTDASARRARRTVPQRLLIGLNVVVIVGLLAAAAGLGYSYKKFGSIPRIELGELLTASEEGPVAAGAENYLVVGVDSAAGLDPDDPLARSRTKIGGIRSDTMMILRVDPASTRAALLSLPRDLFVPIAGTRGSDKLNAAVQIGGPEMLIETIENYLGIDINHYVQVDFFGFFRLVEAIDGVPVYFPNPVRDRRSGLDVPEPGCTVLDPANALGFVRSRAYQEYVDGRWRTDGTGDLGRIRRQQLFVLAALDRSFERGLRNPVTLDELIDSALDAVTLDDTLDGNDIISLARQFRKFEPTNLDLYDLPVEFGTVGGASIVRLQTRPAQPILDVFRSADPGGVTEAAVRVRVLNGTGAPGQAASVAGELRSVGFAIGGAGDADRLGVRRSELRYPAGAAAAADLVDRWTNTELRRIRDDTVDTVTIVTGADWAGLRDHPLPAPSTSTTSTLATTTTTEPVGPTTSVVGTIPVAPPDGIACG